MLWLKAFHVVFMVTWFPGFFLPRLFVYHSMTDTRRHRSLKVMERSCLRDHDTGAVLTLASGSDCAWIRSRGRCMPARARRR